MGITAVGTGYAVAAYYGTISTDLKQNKFCASGGDGFRADDGTWYNVNIGFEVEDG